MLVGHLEWDEHTACGDELVVRQAFSEVGEEPEAEGDQQQNKGAEQETAFPFQAGFAEQTFESTVGHGELSAGIRGQ